MTLAISNLCWQILPTSIAGLPTQSQSQKSLYSTKIWDVKSLQKYFSTSEKNPLRTDEIINVDEKIKLVNC